MHLFYLGSCVLMTCVHYPLFVFGSYVLNTEEWILNFLYAYFWKMNKWMHWLCTSVERVGQLKILLR